jgi:HEAT repeat protein
MELLVNWHFDESAAILSTLRRHSQEASPIGQKKKESAAKALRTFSGRGLDVVCADLNAPSKDRQNGAYRVLAEMGESAVEPLIEALERSIDPRSQQAIIQALKRLGPVVKEPLLKKLHANQPAEILTKLIPLLEDFADVTLLPTFSNVLQHPDALVRRQVMQILARIEQPQIQSLLISLLDDTDPEIQGEAVRALSGLRLSGTLAELTKRLATAAPSVQEKICIALGNFGDRSAIPTLVNLLHGDLPFWKRVLRQPGVGRGAVRVRAATALGQLLPDREGEKALTKALNDSENMVRRAAQAALKKPPLPQKQTASPQMRAS